MHQVQRRLSPLLIVTVAALFAALMSTALADPGAETDAAARAEPDAARHYAGDSDRRAGKRRQLEQTLRQTDAALRAMGAGNPGPYIALWEHSPDVTLFGAWGPIERGYDALRETFEWVGSRFSDGALVPENDIVEMSGSLAYTVGFERGMVRVDGGPLIPMTIRVSHVYHYTHGQWRIRHRHADFPPADQRPNGARR